MELLINLADFWKQLYTISPIIDKGSAIEVAIPNKAAYRAFNEIRMERNQKLLCRVCGSKPILHVCDEDEGECGRFELFVAISTSCWCISNEGYFDGARWNICLNCETYHLNCKSCDKYCKLISHGGWFVKKNPKKLKDDIRIVTPDRDQYIIPKESKLNYISNMVAFPTGPDGGECHTWVCENENCQDYNLEHCFSDK
jgi:hypothetical protein